MSTTAKQSAHPASATTRVRRTRQILRSALLALLQSKPYEQITARDIATEAELGYATFFRHYPSKAELLDEIIEDEIKHLLKVSVPHISAAATYKAALALCTSVYEHQALWNALLAGGAADALRASFVKLSIAKRSRTAPSANWLPMELAAVLGVGVTIDTIRWWLEKPKAHTPEEVAQILDRLIVAPLVGPKK